MYFERHFHAGPAVRPQNSRPVSSWEQSQSNAHDLVNREESSLEEHILRTYLWLSIRCSLQESGHLRVSALCQAYAGLGHGDCPGDHSLSVCSKDRNGRTLESAKASVVREANPLQRNGAPNTTQKKFGC